MADEKEILEQENQDTEQDEFDSAFEEASKGFAEDGDLDTFDGDTDEDLDDSPDEDPSDTDEQDEEDLPLEDDDSQDDDDDIDWKALYERTATHTQQLQQRYDQVEAQFNSWRGRVEAEKAKPENKKAPTADELTKASEDELKEFIELYPDFAAPIQQLIDARVTERVADMENKFNDFVEKNVTPLQRQVQQAEAQAHEAAILNAHPDIQKYVTNGTLEQWVAKLPPYQRTGAQYVIAQGTADEVVQLISDFKNAIGSKDTQQQPPKDKKKSSDNIAAKARDAMYVKSDKSSAPQEKEPSDPRALFNEFAKQVMEEG